MKASSIIRFFGRCSKFNDPLPSAASQYLLCAAPGFTLLIILMLTDPLSDIYCILGGAALHIRREDEQHSDTEVWD